MGLKIIIISWQLIVNEIWTPESSLRNNRVPLDLGDDNINKDLTNRRTPFSVDE
jgi:hypothetical protein